MTTEKHLMTPQQRAERLREKVRRHREELEQTRRIRIEEALRRNSEIREQAIRQEG